MQPNKIYNLEEIISFRRDIHKYPETAFNEFKTGEKIITMLAKFGVDTSKVVKLAKTGIILDIHGKALKEDNPHLEYESTNPQGAHMCGHDGHMAALLGGVAKLMEHIDKIPEDKVVRLLFQPAEEGPGGAYPMIQEGCLDEVDEIYGAHGYPVKPPGYVAIKDGILMAEITSITITVRNTSFFKSNQNSKFIGLGGHGSTPELANDPLQHAVDFHLKFRELVKEYKDKGIKFACTVPVLQVGEANNVIAEKARLEGTLRSFDTSFTSEFKLRLKEIAEDVSLKNKGRVEIDLNTEYPPVINHKKETENVIRAIKRVYGEDKVTEVGLPKYGSEDFAFFLQKIPGAFFFPTTWKQNITSLHSNHYDFNDDALEQWTELWLRLLEDRFEMNFGNNTDSLKTE